MAFTFTNSGNVRHRGPVTVQFYSESSNQLLSTFTRNLILKSGHSKRLSFSLPSAEPVRIVIR